MIIDSHCHLDYPELYENLDEVIKRANKKKITHLLTISTTLNSFEKIKIIVKKYDKVYGTVGIHPHETKNFLQINSNELKKLKNESNKIIGIGETGLDYYYNHSEKKIQKKSFIEHIKAASELGIPVIVHSRNADNDILDILKEENKNKKLKILLHCFTGNDQFAKKLLDLDAYISISGIITFEKSYELTNVVSNIPLNRLLVETDSPYLSPVPFRGKPNEPSYIIHTLNKISQIKKISSFDLMKQTSENFFKFFNIN